MGGISRRRFLVTTAAASTAVSGAATAVASAAEAGEAAAASGPFDVTSADQQYTDLVRGFNQRWVAKPDYVRMVSTPGQVVTAVQAAVKAGKRLSVRSGGHCYEPWVGDGVNVVVDVSEMNQVYFDSARQVFVVEAGATISEIYKSLYKKWG